MDPCPALLQNVAGARLALIAQSHARLTGRRLIADGADPASALWSSPSPILAHNNAHDPLFIFGNRLALELFEMTPQQLLSTPSRLSAEAGLREERARLLERVGRDNFIDDYLGIRISATGRRFRILATVWNLVDPAGLIHGQAACFQHWTRLD